MSTEIWKAVVGYEGYYEVSDLGNVRSLDRIVSSTSMGKPCERKIKGHIIAHNCLVTGGYHTVSLYKDGKERRCKVQRLVLEAFVGTCPDGYVSCHNNGNIDDNSIDNLRWDTQENNLKDKRKHGTHRQGEKINFNKITRKEAIEICERLLENRDSMTAIAKDYCISYGCVSNINLGKSWKQLNYDRPIRSKSDKKYCTGLNKSILSKEQIHKVIELLGLGLSQQNLAQKFGVGQTVISRIKRRKGMYSQFE